MNSVVIRLLFACKGGPDAPASRIARVQAAKTVTYLEDGDFEASFFSQRAATSPLGPAPIIALASLNEPQNVSRTPICAANGMPTVVPGPKKSPSAPAGTRNWFRLVIGCVCVQAAFKQNAVML